MRRAEPVQIHKSEKLPQSNASIARLFHWEDSATCSPGELWYSTTVCTFVRLLDLMPDKSWRGMRPGPVTALCISNAFPDCIQTFASCFVCSGVQLTWIFFFWLCFETPLHSCKCVYLPESEEGITLKQVEKWTRKKCASLSLHL